MYIVVWLSHMLTYMKLYEPPPFSSGPLAPKPPPVLGEPSVGNHCIHI